MKINAHADVRFGSKADIAAPLSDVRFTPNSGLCQPMAMSALCEQQTSGQPLVMIGPLGSKHQTKGQDEPPATSSFHGRERRAEGPNGRRRMEYARSESRCTCVYDGQRLAKPIGILSGSRRY